MTTRLQLEASIGGLRAGSESCRVMLREDVTELIQDVGDEELIRIAELLIEFADERK